MTGAVCKLIKSCVSKEKPTELKNKEKNLRSILVASIENHKGIGLSKKVLLVQLVCTKLHGGVILQNKIKQKKQSKK